MMRRVIALTALVIGILTTVTKVQHKYKIAEDGVYGPQTLTHMLWRGSFPGATGTDPDLREILSTATHRAGWTTWFAVQGRW